MRLSTPVSGTPTAAADAHGSTIHLWIVNTFVAVLLYAGAFYCYLAQPLWYRALIIEDGIGEYLTVTLYLAAAVFLALHIIDRKGRCFGHLLLLACFIFMAGEEISWGQRIFGIATPASWAAINYQQELSVHNLVRINRYMNLMAWLILLWAATTPWLPRYRWYRWLDNSIGIPAAKGYQFPLFLLAVHFINSKPFFYGAELGELLTAVAFFAYASAHWPASQSYAIAVSSGASALTLAGAIALSIAYPQDGAFRTLRLADNYAYNKLCWQAASLYEMLQTRTERLASMTYSPHHATISYARMLRYAGDEPARRELLERWSEKLSTVGGAMNQAIFLEQLGDVYLHLHDARADEHYARALTLQRERADDEGASVLSRYRAFIRIINLEAKRGDLQAADAAYAQILKLGLDVAQVKRLKNQLAEYRTAKETGAHPLTLTPTRKESWGTLGSEPVGDCTLRS